MIPVQPFSFFAIFLLFIIPLVAESNILLAKENSEFCEFFFSKDIVHCAVGIDM